MKMDHISPEEPRISSYFEGDVQPQQYMAAAKKLRIDENYHQAAAMLEEAVEIFPDDSLLWHQLGKTYSNTDETLRAIESFNEAVALNPADTRAKTDLIRARERQQVENASAYRANNGY